MEVPELQQINEENFAAIVNTIQKEKENIDVKSFLEQLDPKKHKVHSPTERPDKIKKDKGGRESPVKVARLSIPLQKLIVSRAAAFLCGNPIQLFAQPTLPIEDDFLSIIKKVWDDNKLDYKSMALAEMMMSETECAELWYTQPAEKEYWAGTSSEGSKQKLRLRILAKSLGDDLYPVFDAAGDMIGFGRGYKVKVGDQNVEHFDLYQPEKTIKGTKSDVGWVLAQEPNPSGKIPVIYYHQPLPEWSDVQEMIERLETVISNHADTNDYFGSPMVFISGEIAGFADKGESGKVVQGKNGATAEYLTWDQSPESVKLEIENLLQFIFDTTDTPKISLQEMKSLGTFSGIALKMLFLGAHLKSARKEGIFGEGIQRRINYLKAALAKINNKFESAQRLMISPKFEYYLPKNEQEAIDILSTAIGGGKAIMSQDSAIAQNPLVQDVEAEKKKMIEEGSYGADIETA
ncbi:phage portal protein [Chitinophaga lutea]|uniref:Phage portal protein n=1 Tax=Chitinophaga lutea TaxID=2488634 RepID=A0A3N4PBR9_9BACT|nr:phage portal protein [Chitinophaga lutea]RPE05545.1 phage portal protein [Chitinophaga lutea]